MPADYKTSLNELMIAAHCNYLCFSEEERVAVDLLIRAYELAGIAGQPNYVGKTGVALLVQDAKTWTNQVLNMASREAIAMYIDHENAVAVNAATPSGPGATNTLKAQSTCYQCIPYEQKKNLLLYLKWRLNKLSEPE